MIICYEYYINDHNDYYILLLLFSCNIYELLLSLLHNQYAWLILIIHYECYKNIVVVVFMHYS